MTIPQKPNLQNACPLCQKPTDHAFRPFCSSRCKQVDLGRWFQEAYCIPAEEEDVESLYSDPQ
ncbi:MAG: DNA gyrase inhibitor YacG [Alphaproteobacteria bacterium]|nr:DNA gyrase inhibitor YacG [Alphaproteobacteria bacterium]